MTTPVNPYPDQTGYGTSLTPEEGRPIQGYTGPYVSDTEHNPMVTDNIPQQADPKAAIEYMYQQNLGRGSDEGGLGSWLAAYQNGMSMDDINNAIRGSQEGQGYQTGQNINEIYNKVLGRDADQGGLDFYKNSLQSGSSMDDIRNSIYGSQEAMDYRMKPQVSNEPQFDPVYFDPDGNPHRAYQPGYTSPVPLKPEMFNEPERDPRRSSPYPADLITPYPNQNPDGQGFSIPQPKPYVDPYAGTMYEGTGGPSAPYRGDFNGQGFSQAAADPVYDFVQNIAQQPQYLQRAFQEQLQRFGDPVVAGRAVLGSLR